MNLLYSCYYRNKALQQGLRSSKIVWQCDNIIPVSESRSGWCGPFVLLWDQFHQGPNNLLSLDKILSMLPFKFYLLCQRNKLEKNPMYWKDEAHLSSIEGDLVRRGEDQTCCVGGVGEWSPGAYTEYLVFLCAHCFRRYLVPGNSGIQIFIVHSVEVVGKKLLQRILFPLVTKFQNNEINSGKKLLVYILPP